MSGWDFSADPNQHRAAEQGWAELRREQLAAYVAQRQREEERLQDIVRQVAREEIMQVLKDMETGAGYEISPVLYAHGRLLERMSQTQERM